MNLRFARVQKHSVWQKAMRRLYALTCSTVVAILTPVQQARVQEIEAEMKASRNDRRSAGEWMRQRREGRDRDAEAVDTNPHEG
ncbi:MAG: hypothetical protein Ct9H300mP25_15100 [Acidobacteriota bacterium]|nr:MAG: hypothetical protein Ct9H300mP25_15100 [Acidobacteriota bacterium]